MSREDAAYWAGLSLRTIDRAVRAGKLRVRKVGRATRIWRESIDEWILSGDYLDARAAERGEEVPA